MSISTISQNKTGNLLYLFPLFSHQPIPKFTSHFPLTNNANGLGKSIKTISDLQTKKGMQPQFCRCYWNNSIAAAISICDLSSLVCLPTDPQGSRGSSVSNACCSHDGKGEIGDKVRKGSLQQKLPNRPNFWDKQVREIESGHWTLDFMTF